jgi:hydrogenase maturation protease
VRLRGGLMGPGLPAAVTGRVLIGGVGYRWFGDQSFGLLAGDTLAGLDWPPGVEVADLGYGALHVALDLADADPPYERVVLIAVTERGREPGRLYRFRHDGATPDTEQVQARLYEAAAGVIDLDHLLVIGRHLGALPDDVVAVELEPRPGSTGDRLSPQAQALLPRAVELARREALAPRASPPHHPRTT